MSTEAQFAPIEQVDSGLQKADPRAYEIATSSPSDWVTRFDREAYRNLVACGDPILIAWVESLAEELDQRGATDLALQVRAGGMMTQQLLWENAGGDTGLACYFQTQNYLLFLDREVGEGIVSEDSETGMYANVLCGVLQLLARDFLEEEAARIRLH